MEMEDRAKRLAGKLKDASLRRDMNRPDELTEEDLAETAEVLDALLVKVAEADGRYLGRIDALERQLEEASETNQRHLNIINEHKSKLAEHKSKIDQFGSKLDELEHKLTGKAQ